MRLLGSKKKWVAATIGVALIGTLVTVAVASHTPFNFTTTPLATGNLVNKVKANSDRIKFQTKGPTDVRVARVDIAPGGYSGWHHHPGIVIVTVASGAVTFTHSDCSTKTYGPGLPDGAVFVESGDDPGQASSADGATLYGTFVAPHANPPVFRIDDHDFPGCARHRHRH
jgi:quercetin dioxygenase-like cupin family protein